WPSEVESDASGGESCGDGVPIGGPRPAPERGSVGGLSASDESAAGHTGGVDGHGAQAGADRVSGVEARTALRAAESGGIPGADEGEADQGAEAQGASVGAGADREAVGGQCNGGGAGAGLREGQIGVRQVCRPGRGCAPMRTRTRGGIGALSNLSE